MRNRRPSIVESVIPEKVLNKERLKLEVIAVGLPDYSIVREGIPFISGLTDQQKEALSAVLSAHVSDDSQYIKIDFESSEEALKVRAVTDELQWKSYCSVQINLIKSKREEAYKNESDSAFFDYQSGGITKEEWMAKREEVASRYPYPGTYR